MGLTVLRVCNLDIDRNFAVKKSLLQSDEAKDISLKKE